MKIIELFIEDFLKLNYKNTVNSLFLKYTIKDFLKLKRTKKIKLLNAHIQAAMDWLCMAQDANSDGGVSLRYSLIKGWDASYPETTGYIIPSFFNYATLTKKDEYIQRAVRMADWLLSIQKEDGSFNGGPIGSGYESFVFDTGQILFGLIAAHKTTDKDKYLEGAIEAGKWLVIVQDKEGMWKNNAFNSIPHTYYTRVAWALAELGVYIKDNTYTESACRNINWALTKQQENGWFDCAGFTGKTHSTPYTHTIAYTMEGILETGILINKKDYIQAIACSANALCEVIEKNKFCHGTYDQNWNSNVKYSCLTGNAQIAIILLRLYEIYKNEKYLKVAKFLNGFLCETQEIYKPSRIIGAIGGSYPVWGKYQRFAFPNWAAKFFIDSLLQERKLASV